MTNSKIWKGRVDSEKDDLAKRWHQCIASDASTNGLSLLGFCCDAGVARNQGRVGANKAPDIIKQAMSNLPSNYPLQKHIYDAGNIFCYKNEDLEVAQQYMADATKDLLFSSGRVINIGGGHETAWASFLAAASYLKDLSDKNSSLGIINFDAHLDMRHYDLGASSGSPFLQAADYCEKNKIRFNYLCLGVSEMANTKALFALAKERGAKYIFDVAMQYDQLADLKQSLQTYIDSVDNIYLSIDLDVFPSYISPGVSAPSSFGVSQFIIESLIAQIVNSNKMLLADIVECNPDLDIDNRTAKLAARLAYLLAK